MTQDEIIELYTQAGLNPNLWNFTDAFEVFAKLVAEREREACAVICETYWNRPNNGMSTEEEVCGSVTAELIRARGQE
jgi:hypothetical protein